MRLLLKRVQRGLSTYRRTFFFYAATIFACVCVFVAFTQSGLKIDSSYEKLCAECVTSNVMITGFLGHEQLEMLSQLESVEGISPKLTAAAELKAGGEKHLILLDIYRQEPLLDKYKIVEGCAQEGGALLSFGFAKYNGFSLGDEISVVTDSGVQKDLVVCGFYISASEAYAASVNEFNGKNGRVKLIDDISQYNSVSVAISDTATFDAFLREFEKLGLDGCAAVETRGMDSFVAIKTTTNNYSIIGTFIGLIVLIIGVVLGAFFIARLITLQSKSIASLKAVAYPNKMIIGYYVLLVAMITLIASLTGVAIGLLVSQFIQSRVINDLLLPRTTALYVPGLLIVPVLMGLMIVISFFVSIRIVKQPISHIFSLTVRRQSRHILLERIPMVWNTLSSRTQNNLRVVLRHKTRAIMSIIGISMGLILCMSVLTINYMNSNFSRDMLNQTCSYQLQVSGHSQNSFREIVDAVKNCNSVTSYSIVYEVEFSITVGEHTYTGACLLLDDENVNYNVFAESGGLLKIPPKGIIMNKSIADYLGLSQSHKLQISKENNENADTIVSALCGQYYGFGLFMSQAEYKNLFGMLPQTQTLLIAAEDGDAVQSEINKIEGSYCINIEDEFDTLQKNNRTSALTFLAIAGIGTIFAALLFISTTSTVATEREREYIILRSLGVQNYVIISSLAIEWGILAFVGLVVSIPLARLVVYVLMQMTVSDYTLLYPDFVPIQCIVFSIAVLIISLILSLLLFYAKLKQMKITDLGSKE